MKILIIIAGFLLSLGSSGWFIRTYYGRDAEYRQALEAGASGIVVSNHGGRVLDQCPATAEVLPAIVDETAKKVFEEQGMTLEYHVGTMIEIPRAAVIMTAIIWMGFALRRVQRKDIRSWSY